MTKKLTYVEAIEQAINGSLTDEGKEKLINLQEQLKKRNNVERKPTKTQQENNVLKSRINDLLTTEGKQCKDIATELGISGQKCSALLKQLVDSGFAQKYIEKRVTYFTMLGAEPPINEGEKND